MTRTQHRLTVFFGDTPEYLADLAREHDACAWLMDSSNYQTVEAQRRSHDVTVYSSLGDLPTDLTVIYDILCKADRIVYCPPARWSDNKTVDILDPGSSIQGLTEIILLLLPRSVEVTGLAPFSPDQHDPKFLVDQRKTDLTQIWIAGCSISHGVGVEPEQRWGYLLAQALNLPCSFLTRPGSAIDWAADQILRSDIRSGDIVAWGLTNWNRITYVHNHSLLEGINGYTYTVHPYYQKIVSIENLLLDHTLYNHYYAIRQVDNYCAKIGANLMLVGVMPDNGSLLGFLKSQPNYIHITYDLTYQDSRLQQKFTDLGSDQLHPGPLQHQLYTKAVLDFIQAN